MNASNRLGAIYRPFTVTVLGLGVLYVVLTLAFPCWDPTTCAAVGFTAGPIALVVILLVGFPAGFSSSATRSGFGEMAAGAALVVAAYALTYSGSSGDFLFGWAFFSLAAILLLTPGFAIGRYLTAKRARAAALATELSRLQGLRDANALTDAEYQAQRTVAIQASKGGPPAGQPGGRDMECSRCGKPQGWGWKRCEHCKASYDEHPPRPRPSPETSVST